MASSIAAASASPLAARMSPQIDGFEPATRVEVADNDIESAARLFADLPKGVSAVVGVGGGKALDVAKYVGFLGRLPYYAAPTSLST